MHSIIPEKLEEILESFKHRHIIVLGDIMLDEYLWGKVQRISPEAPVPIIEVNSADYRLGGAANAALNLKVLGAQVSLVGVCGKDTQATTIITQLKDKEMSTSGIFLDSSRPTTLKTRIGSVSQQIVRLDREDVSELDENIQKEIYAYLTEIMPSCDALLIEDYNKGLLSFDLINDVLQLARKHNKLVAVDPKYLNFSSYGGVEIFKPNYRELESYYGRIFTDEDDFERSAEELRQKMNVKYLVVTKGSDGMYLFTGNKAVKHLPSFAREVYDVSGAGDTVISALTLAYLFNSDIESAALIANHSAAVAVAKKGTASVTTKEILDSFNAPY
ncbi:MAG TPA: D-glycero-beta-D-manno-heptose-7-phosphate kinase [Candidatus Cloacimonas sp.]|jgi:rfaE bifunctional protein kinase chain/domain|nr:D-glycero-beta-D-manno-heptose-7-phosphate kinase [Candidatus Cloacimonas sp.]HPH71025.1 D-glycero-beta-D-manno-heptose-7-phosphate kinase [Candidatus Cloacimonas sp.]HPN26441.1 D-glycero-beta-D-manno-heptose-7-phosphate kinase [Candidatus Cloacimonas sp.]HPV63839.1 D-glycero-beta-D-manno-heptose-7-phosphate kinase [Candidatus Cloacimonas sp.]HQB49589.1 D-glycero-beta-D-manno-heptose-7-phosphate kinase [Candidatus Cloacimonas sp.]